MALRPCRECKAKVSIEADVCPHCGVRNPTTSPIAPPTSPIAPPTGKSRIGLITLGVFGIWALIVVAMLLTYEKKTPEQRAQEQAQEQAQAQAQEQEREQAEQKARAQEAQCRTDLQCWGDRNVFEATSKCRDRVERLAKHQAEWVDGWLETKFPRFGWVDKQRGTLRYVGDRIKFQNGFGAWSPMTYTCDFDPATKTVLSVNAWEGRLSE